ncbi:Heme-binding protein 1, partial [Struthio camelus australis]
EVAYEERACEGGKFAAVEVTGKPFDEASKEAVLKLLKYVGGSNDKGSCVVSREREVWSKQTPSRAVLHAPKAPSVSTEYAKSQFQASPPCPSDDSIKIEERQEMTIYSTQFGGYAKEGDYVNYAAKLKSALGTEAVYRKDFYFCNGYDPPMKPYWRRNEVWFVKE